MRYVTFNVWATLCLTALLFLPAQQVTADLKVLTVGDSLTSGLDGLRGSYRPHLEQQIDFFLNTPLNNPNGISVDFVGNIQGPFDTIGGGGSTTPLPVNGITMPGTFTTNTITNWDVDHQGQAGASTSTYLVPSIAADVALVWLGTNDLAINNDSSTFNKSDPLDKFGYGGVSSAQAIFDRVVAPLVAANVEVLVGAIPPIDMRANSPDRTYYWTESPVVPDPFNSASAGYGDDILHRRPDPTNGSPTQDVNNDGDLNDDVNDIISEINAQIEALALATPNVTYVDLLGSTSLLVDDQGNSVAVGAFDTDLTDNGGISLHLVDGIHTNTAGDQVVTGNWLDGGLRAMISHQSGAATAVPEASSFALLFLVGSLMGIVKLGRKKLSD